jgi:trehalose/maltose transport system permease protein
MAALPPRPFSARRAAVSAGRMLGVALLLSFALFPFYWAVASSLKTSTELHQTPPTYWPKSPAWENYALVFERQPFGRAIANSAAVSGGSAGLALLFGAAAAYAIGRYRFRGRQAVYGAILAISVFPQVSILGGMRALLQSVGLDTAWGGWRLVFSYLVFTLPFTAWVLTTFAKRIPRELEDSAMVDGANAWQTFWHIGLPMMRPGLVAAGLLAFIQAWNEFLFALTFCGLDADARTIPVAIAMFSGASQHELPWGQAMAASVIASLPLALMVALFERHIVGGLTAGAVKG